ncbi:anti-sigma-factor antagonist [Mycolicibacterium tokaiense]|uniref:Anti-sigma-factor antagonist n=2 Tax=Mycolicibacterium tokaiense TaxID=39695 RepID=A0A378TE17_9MYCO|nr:anti-sigma-factor antagonist [Mycolicibacterium tokaiense]
MGVTMSTKPISTTFERAVVAWHDDHVTITLAGDLDAANAEDFGRFVTAHLRPGRALHVDLSTLQFFGTAGFSALHMVNVGCAAAGIRWTVSASEPVARVLRICDPDRTLPVVTTHSS